MFTLDLLRVALARAVDFRGEVPLEGTPIVCIVVRDAKGLEQRLQLYKDFVRAPAKDVRQNLPGTVIDSMSQLNQTTRHWDTHAASCVITAGAV